MDYYTGLIYEAVTEGSAPPPPPTTSSLPILASRPPKAKKATNGDDEPEVDESLVGVGSIAAGGRYDDLVGMFSGSTSAAGKIPCVGISFGVERIFSLLLAKAKEMGLESGRGKATEVFVMSVGDGLLEERMRVCAELWAAGIKVRLREGWGERADLSVAAGRVYVQGQAQASSAICGRRQGQYSVCRHCRA